MNKTLELKKKFIRSKNKRLLNQSLNNLNMNSTLIENDGFILKPN